MGDRQRKQAITTSKLSGASDEGNPPALAAPPLPNDPKLYQLRGRLSDEQRERFRIAFLAVRPDNIFNWAWIYFSRELRLKPRYRDWLSIETLMRLSAANGTIGQIERAVDRVEWEIWANIDPPQEAFQIAEWELETKQRRGLKRWEAKSPGEYPRHWFADPGRYTDGRGYAGRGEAN